MLRQLLHSQPLEAAVVAPVVVRTSKVLRAALAAAPVSQALQGALEQLVKVLPVAMGKATPTLVPAVAAEPAKLALTASTHMAAVMAVMA